MVLGVVLPAYAFAAPDEHLSPGELASVTDNYHQQGRFTEQNRQRIDVQFAVDMRAACDAQKEIARKAQCIVVGIIYYNAVHKYVASF